jgi:hypothetical protein
MVCGIPIGDWTGVKGVVSQKTNEHTHVTSICARPHFVIGGA